MHFRKVANRLLAVALLAILTAVCFAQRTVIIIIDGNNVGTGIRQTGATLVPIRPVAEGFGAHVEFSRPTIEIVHGDTRIVLRINDYNAEVNGVSRRLAFAPRQINSRVYVPIRFVSEELGAQVEDVPERGAVEITKGAYDPNPGKLPILAVLPVATQGAEKESVRYYRDEIQDLLTKLRIESLSEAQVRNVADDVIGDTAPDRAPTKDQMIQIGRKLNADYALFVGASWTTLRINASAEAEYLLVNVKSGETELMKRRETKVDTGRKGSVENTQKLGADHLVKKLEELIQKAIPRKRP